MYLAVAVGHAVYQIVLLVPVCMQVAVVIFQPVTPVAAEQEDSPDEWVQPELLLHNGCEIVDGLAHVGITEIR